MKDSSYEQALDSLEPYFPEMAKARQAQREQEAELQGKLQILIDNAAELEAKRTDAYNFCRANNIDPSNPNWLAERDADLCKQQREACEKEVGSLKWSAFGFMPHAIAREHVCGKILGAPAPAFDGKEE